MTSFTHCLSFLDLGHPPEEDDGSVWVSLNDPAYLQARHGFPEELMGNLAGAGALIQRIVEGRSS